MASMNYWSGWKSHIFDRDVFILTPGRTHWLGCRSSMAISTPFSWRREAVYFCETCLLFLALLLPGFALRRRQRKTSVQLDTISQHLVWMILRVLFNMFGNGVFQNDTHEKWTNHVFWPSSGVYFAEYTLWLSDKYTVSCFMCMCFADTE